MKNCQISSKSSLFIEFLSYPLDRVLLHILDTKFAPESKMVCWGSPNVQESRLGDRLSRLPFIPRSGDHFSRKLCPGDILSQRPFVPACFCPGNILTLRPFVPATFCAGDFVCRRYFVPAIFALATFCPGDVLSRRPFCMATSCPGYQLSRRPFVQAIICPDDLLSRQPSTTGTVMKWSLTVTYTKQHVTIT